MGKRMEFTSHEAGEQMNEIYSVLMILDEST